MSALKRSTTRHHLATICAALGLVVLAACHSAVPQTDAAAPPDNAWQVASSGSMHLQLPPRFARDKKGISVDVRVLVDSTGQAVMPTLRITGPGGDENRTAITQFIRESNFKPTPKNTAAQPGYYHNHVEISPP